METLKIIGSQIKQKGFIELTFQLSTLLLRRIYSLVAVGIYRVRGYRIDFGVIFSPSADFFQSSYGAITISKETQIRRNTRVHAGFAGVIRIGERVLVDEGTCIMAQARITIGNDVLIAPHCFIVDFNHRFDRKDVPIASQGYDAKAITIEENVWIGANCVILPGVTIGRGSVVGAGSVVTSSIAPYSVVVGAPAKSVKRRV